MNSSQFKGWYIPKTVAESRTSIYGSNSERIIYVGCVHGGNLELLKRLEEISRTPPDLLVFTGDLTGSPEMEELKRRFYNYVSNRSKQFLKERPGATDQELLQYVGLNPPEPGMTLKDGYKLLLSYQFELQPLRQDEINKALAELTETEIAQAIRDISQFTYYGEWAATLPRQVRQAILTTLANSAQSLLEPINKIRAQGTRVIMVEGNWDNPKTTGVRVIAGKDIKDFFDTKKFFIDNGFQFADQIITEETVSTLHILLPYKTILDFQNIPQEQIDKIKTLASNARGRGKQVIIVGHAVPNLRIHSLSVANLEVKGEPWIVSMNFCRLIATLWPDEVTYGHLHDPIMDEAGNQISPNTKYVLEILEDEENVRLVEDPNEIGRNNKQVIVTYIPLRRIAQLTIPIEGFKSILGGDRLPIMLT